MFSSLANYLLGSASLEPQYTAPGDVRVRAVDSDDDWVLVEKSEDKSSEDEDGSSECLPTLELAVARPFPSSYRVLSDAVDCYSLTRTSSTSSLPCLSFEESWFLTPPPCFTSEGPVHMETSPLENLLIEHPSMSVYQHSTSMPCFVPRKRHRSSSTGSAPSSPASSISLEPATPSAEIAPRQRQAVLSLQQQQEKQCYQLRSAQKLRQLRACQLLKRNHLDRSNKAREINSRNRCQRRSDHMQRHSGANNNRKC